MLEEGDTEDDFLGGTRAQQVEEAARVAPHVLAELEKGGRLYQYR